MSETTGLSNENVIPVIESRLFDQHPDARFAAGVLAVNDQVKPGLEKEYAGYYDLRRNVYVDQTKQLSVDDLHEDGTDRDSDDARSIAFGIIENRGLDQRVVATMRLILKGYDSFTEDRFEGDYPLPVETFCPEVFEANPAPSKSFEVSRLISRHEKASIQDFLSWKVYPLALAQVINHNLGPAYAVVEPWFERHATRSGVPVKSIGKARYIEHYQDENLPIKVDLDRLEESIDSREPGLMDELRVAAGAMTYFGKLRTPSAAA